MSYRVLVAPDKFKGTLTASEAAGAIANGWWSVRPQDELECVPMSDGGDGFGLLVGQRLGAQERATETVDAAGRPRVAPWWWDEATGTAVIESAAVIGLALLPQGRFHPFELDTRGMGAVVEAVRKCGANRVYVGIGGSATNDAGVGMARALGWNFFDEVDREVERWIQLDRLARWTPPEAGLAGEAADWVVAVDVQNPLLGAEGCTRIYGPQKGIRPEQAPMAEAALTRLAEVARRELGTDLATEPGAGAAGGLGFGFRAFVGARLAPGFEIFANLAGLEEKVAQSDLVLTGEGMLDRSTLMGKGTGQLAEMCRRAGKRCFGIAGAVEAAGSFFLGNRLFERVYGIAPTLTSPAEAKANAAVWLERLAAKVARDLSGE